MAVAVAVAVAVADLAVAMAVVVADLAEGGVAAGDLVAGVRPLTGSGRLAGGAQSGGAGGAGPSGGGGQVGGIGEVGRISPVSSGGGHFGGGGQPGQGPSNPSGCGGVRTGTGEALFGICRASLTQEGMGGYYINFGVNRQYSSFGSGTDGSGLGVNWSDPNVPALVAYADSVDYLKGNGDSFVFKKVPSGGGGLGFDAVYKPTYFVQDQLAQDPGSGNFTVFKPHGGNEVYSDIGQLQQIIDPYGNVMTFTYTDGVLTSASIGADANQVEYQYSTDILDLEETVVLVVGGVNVRRIKFTYTSDWNLELVELQDPSGDDWATIKHAYFRYYDGTALMQFAVEDDAYNQMQSVNPAWPQGADDATVAQYADQQFVYDDQARVIESITNGGKYTFGFAYDYSGFGGKPNNWASKTTVTVPDGSIRTYYYNDASSLMLQQVTDVSGNVWYPICQRFDDNQRMTLSASSSTVKSVTESKANLFALHSRIGMVQVYQYDDNGNTILQGLREGADGPLIVQQESTYGLRNIGDASIYPIASQTVYRDATDTSSSNPATTTYSYTWFEPTFQMDLVTTTQPEVAVAENGSGSTYTTQAAFNEWGFMTSFLDQNEILTTYQYDITTGAMTEMVQDAGGLNLTTTYEVDKLGRRTLMLGPEHTISLGGAATTIRRAQWTQYLDLIHQVRTINGYVSGGTSTVINPVLIKIDYIDDPEATGGRMEEKISAAWSGSGVPDPGYTFAQASYVRWATWSIDPNNELTHSRVYHLVPASGLGVAGTNYAETDYGYNTAGRQNQVTSPAGTITLQVFNAMSWLTQTSIGTTLSNIVPVELLQYDGGADRGDGNLTKRTLPVDSSASHNRITTYSYNWRDQQTMTQGSDGTRTIITENAFDNRDNIIQVDQYETTANPAHLINRTKQFYDALGRAYQTQTFGVASGGTVGAALTSNLYYDPVGRVARNTPSGEVGFTAMVYDAVGRPTARYQAYGGTLDTSDPGDISTSTVIEQWQSTYDAASNVIATLNAQRFDDATGTGALASPAVQPKARIYYVANYPDALGRVIAMANYGTNGGGSWTRPATIPASSATVLVTAFLYDNAGQQSQVTDPMGIATQSTFDQAGRRVALIENYQPGSGPGPSVNKTTEFAYNDDGNMTSLTAVNATTGNQVTQWVYGVTIAGGSTINSNGLLYQKIYPAGSVPASPVTYSYNRQRQWIEMVDPAGTTHVYSYDLFGRLINDAVTTFSSGVDDTIKSIQRAYEPRGMLQTITSFGSGSTVLNQVLLVYNSFSQLAQEYQEHNGEVNLSTSSRVSYSYASGAENTVRPTGITYPDGITEFGIHYTSTAADSLSRADQLTLNGSPLCSYAYLGMNVFVNTTYNAASNIELTAETGGTGDAGDQYTALDRFGRLVETLWTTGGAPRVHSKYGRNRVGGIIWRQDMAAAAKGVNTQDNYYWYDGLQQLQMRQMGQLNGTAPAYTGIIYPPSQEEDFGYDATGNWVTYDILDPVDSQARTHNTANQITELVNSAPSATPPTQYDAAGNMTMAPRTDTWASSDELVYDAWNRLVEVIDASGFSTTTVYGYDGLTRRIRKTSESEDQDYYYSKDWQVLQAQGQEAVPSSSSSSEWSSSSSSEAMQSDTKQMFWGLKGIDDLILRAETIAGDPSQQLYALNDQWNVVAVTDTDANVLERYGYNAFGTTLFMNPSFASRSVSYFDWETTFCGYRLDHETGFYQVRYRYLHPTLGRWVSRDLIEEWGGFNLYGYILNDSTNRHDPFGLFNWIWFTLNTSRAVMLNLWGQLAPGSLSVAGAGALWAPFNLLLSLLTSGGENLYGLPYILNYLNYIQNDDPFAPWNPDPLNPTPNNSPDPNASPYSPDLGPNPLPIPGPPGYPPTCPSGYSLVTRTNKNESWRNNSNNPDNPTCGVKYSCVQDPS